MKNFKLMIGMISFAALATASQPALAGPNDFIVRMQPGMKLDPSLFGKVEALVPSLQIYLVSPKIGVQSVRSILSSQRGVMYAHGDHPVKLRAGAPNDADFAKQWALNQANSSAHIHALDAWKLGTGGQTPLGDDIVVAVVDGGVDLSHPDLEGNIWKNEKEIPGNGIDDDGNGYVDDVFGWDAINNTGTIKPSFHATHVAGIVGARGNNGKQVAGINWQVKIMNVTGATGTTSIALKAYNYVLEMKKRYLKSGGREGANIVVTNSSFGVDQANCMAGEYTAWNDVYTAMGEVGVLSAAATANRNYDVDKVGDVPTGCESPYLIAVTNTTSTDERNGGAAFGKKNVDLGAPGTDVFSLADRGGARTATGTSMATPQVAGSVAFMYSVASQSFAQYARQEPAKAALLVKQILLDTTDPIAALKDITVTGGRLNLARAAETIANAKPGTLLPRRDIGQRSHSRF